MRCKVCTNYKRLEIDRAIMGGQTYVSISKAYGVPALSVMKHAKNHLSRQLLKADETKILLNNRALLEGFQKLIKVTQDLIEDAENKNDTKWKHVLLGAVREQREMYTFWVKFSAWMELAKNEDEKKKLNNDVETLKDRLRKLSPSEQQLYLKLISKMEGDYDDDIYGDDYFRTDYSRRVRPKVQIDDSLDYDDDDLDDEPDEPVKEVVYHRKKQKPKIEDDSKLKNTDEITGASMFPNAVDDSVKVIL